MQAKRQIDLNLVKQMELELQGTYGYQENEDGNSQISSNPFNTPEQVISFRAIETIQEEAPVTSKNQIKFPSNVKLSKQAR